MVQAGTLTFKLYTKMNLDGTIPLCGRQGHDQIGGAALSPTVHLVSVDP